MIYILVETLGEYEETCVNVIAASKDQKKLELKKDEIVKRKLLNFKVSGAYRSKLNELLKQNRSNEPKRNECKGFDDWIKRMTNYTKPLKKQAKTWALKQYDLSDLDDRSLNNDCFRSAPGNDYVIYGVEEV